jgi:hypothetical protein
MKKLPKSNQRSRHEDEEEVEGEMLDRKVIWCGSILKDWEIMR